MRNSDMYDGKQKIGAFVFFQNLFVGASSLHELCIDTLHTAVSTPQVQLSNLTMISHTFSLLFFLTNHR